MVIPFCIVSSWWLPFCFLVLFCIVSGFHAVYAVVPFVSVLNVDCTVLPFLIVMVSIFDSFVWFFGVFTASYCFLMLFRTVLSLSVLMLLSFLLYSLSVEVLLLFMCGTSNGLYVSSIWSLIEYLTNVSGCIFLVCSGTSMYSSEYL